MGLTENVLAVTASQVNSWNTLRQMEEQLAARKRELAAEINRARLSRRPVFPLPEHIIGIRNAVEALRAGEPGRMHGAPIGPESEPRAVVYSKDNKGWIEGVETGWIQVKALSPWVFEGGGGYLWSFTEDEVAVMVSVLERCGAILESYWFSDGGVSMRFWLSEEPVDYSLVTGGLTQSVERLELALETPEFSVIHSEIASVLQALHGHPELTQARDAS